MPAPDPKDLELELALKSARVHFEQMWLAMVNLGALPFALVAITPEGEMYAITPPFPPSAIPTLEMWNDVWPGNQPFQTMTAQDLRKQ